MIPRYLRDCLKLTVTLMVVFATSSMEQCGTKTSETLRQGYVAIRNLGVKLCQLNCIENGACCEYNIETLTCCLSRDESKKIEKKEGHIGLARNHSDVPTGACASKTCSLGLQCLETRSGKAICVQGNYTERSPQHTVDKKDTLKNNPLHDACRKGDLGRVKRILSRGAVDVNSRGKKLGRTPLMMAAQKGHRRVFDFLIRKGAHVSLLDDYDQHILHWACFGGHVGMVKHVLLLYSFDINSRIKSGSTPLMKAVNRGRRDVFEFLVSMEANVSQVDDLGNNILHWACTGGHARMVKYVLIQYSVDINSRTKSGLTPLMKAVYRGHGDVLEFLVCLGANVSLVDDYGDNILHVAAIRGRVKMVKFILSQDLVNINSRGKFGRTPLMRAAYYRHRAVFDLLVSFGCDVSLKDYDDDNIVHLATYSQHVKMVKHILSQDLVNINSRGKLGRTPLMRGAYCGIRKALELPQLII